MSSDLVTPSGEVAECVDDVKHVELSVSEWFAAIQRFETLLNCSTNIGIV